MRKTIVAALLSAFLGACVTTPYQHMGFTGGVKVSRIDATTLRVTGAGNAFTPGSTIRDYVLLRSAEETIAAGYGHFQVLQASDLSRTTAHATPGTSSSTTSFIGGHAYTTTTYTPGTTQHVYKPGAEALVKMYAGPKAADAPGGVYDANEVIAYLGPKYRKG